MATTIKDLAKATGLGCATISAYLNGVTVRPKNKQAIEAAIAELGYVRNEYARGLKTHRSMTVGVLIPELNNTFATTIISEIEDILRASGYGIIVCDCRTDKQIEQQSLKFLMSKMVDGLIVMPIASDSRAFEAATDSSLPVVAIDRMTESDRVSHVVINNREISRRAVERLVEEGHKSIAIITGDTSVYTACQRTAGYREALEKINCYDPQNVFIGNFSIKGGYRAAKDIINNYPQIDAIFVTNYEMTIGAIIAINEESKKIPEDYSFIGFDNMELSKVFMPRLATVVQPLSQIGKRAAEQLLLLMNGRGCLKNIVLKAELQEGDSIRRRV